MKTRNLSNYTGETGISKGFIFNDWYQFCRYCIAAVARSLMG